MMAASESNPGPTLSALLNKSTLSTANMESSESNKDIIGMNRRKKFIQFPELVDPKKQWEDFIVDLRKNNRMERIESKRKDRIKSKVASTGTETQDPNVISVVEDIMKQVEKQNETIKSLIQNHAEELRASKDKIFELELRLKNYEDGYSPPNSVKISNRVKNEGFQSNQGNGSQSQWNASWNQNDKAPRLEEETAAELGIDGVRKWARDYKQQRYIDLCKKSEKKKEAAKKRIEAAKAKGEMDPLFIKHKWPWEEQPMHTKAQCPGRGFDLVFWNPDKVGKPYGQVLVKDLEFASEKYPRRLILYPSRRTLDGGASWLRDFKIKQDFRGRFNTWWSNFFMAHCHKEGVFFSKEAQVQMFKDKTWHKNCAEPVRNQEGQIVAWGKGVWELNRNGDPKALPVYIGKSRNLVKYSKYDNFVEQSQRKFQVQKFRWVTLADGTVDRTPLSEQNIDRQEKRLRREYQQTYGLKWKKQKESEDFSNDRDREKSKAQDQDLNSRNEEQKEAPSFTKKREEKKYEKENENENENSYGSAIQNAMMSSEEDNKEMKDDSAATKNKKKRSGKAKTNKKKK